ncbi:hypothetical protein DX910_00580 [Acinetobacter haemolyticus]|nr:hypothetical protein DX910_00580 [Acinetobacter haemolyticus]
MNAKTVAAEWAHVEDNPPNKRVMCLCEDGKIRFGNPVCGDGYFYLDTKVGPEVVEFWQELPNLKEVQNQYWAK